MSEADADIAIVGGGLIACMTAHRLRQRGRSVIVLERGLVGGESSGVSFGSLRLQGQHDPELGLALRAQEVWEGIEAEIGETVGFARHGHVHLALTAEHEERMERNAVQARGHGLEIEISGRNRTLDRWPFLSERVRASSWSSRDATVNPRLVAPAFARAARRLGADIREGCEVVGAGQDGRGFTLRCRGADGAGFDVTSRMLINAAGAWAGSIAAAFGERIPLFAAGPAELVTEPVPAFAAPVFHVVDGSVLFRQTDRGNVVVGGHPRLPVDPATRGARVPPDKIATNLGRLVAIVPHLRAHHLIRSWTGVEAYVEDMMPVLGPSATTPGLFHACAFSGHGLQLGPAAALALADLVTRGDTTLPVAPLGIGRFARGASRTRKLAEEFQSGVLATHATATATSRSSGPSYPS